MAPHEVKLTDAGLAMCVQCGAPKRSAKFCSRRCAGLAQGKDTATKFWMHTTPQPNGCIHWNGRPSGNGYSRILVAGRSVLVHRYAWELANGPIPDGLFVCHHCDNRICVNVEHLFLGDAVANMQDMAAKGRAAGSRMGGDNHPTAKLTDAEIREIRARYIKGTRWQSNARALAEEFGVAVSTIQRIAIGRRRAAAGGAIHPIRIFRLRNRLTDADVERLKRLYWTGMLLTEIARRFGVTVHHVSRILRGARRQAPEVRA